VKKKTVGLKIVKIRQMTAEEIEREGWEDCAYEPITVIELEDGTLLYASRDAEGNGPGELFGQKKDEPCFILEVREMP
jgi:hypothetical protein